jgi:hypothetical protein
MNEESKTPESSPKIESSKLTYDELEDSLQKSKRCYLAPLPGHEWNPLLKLPVNMKCPCKSGLKFKMCCRPKLPHAVPENLAKQYRIQMERPDLVFLTPENQEAIKEVMDPKLWEQLQEDKPTK